LNKKNAQGETETSSNIVYS
jgi:hypothetical protein